MFDPGSVRYDLSLPGDVDTPWHCARVPSLIADILKGRAATFGLPIEAPTNGDARRCRYNERGCGVIMVSPMIIILFIHG